MIGPDDNSPTIPDQGAVRRQPAQPGNAPIGGSGPMATPPVYGGPPAGNGGKPPVWDLPATPKGPGPDIRSVGLGLGVALVVLAVIAFGVIAVLLANSNGDPLGAGSATPLPSPTATLNALTPTATQPAPASPDAATDTAKQFFFFLGSQQFQDAYNLYSTNLQDTKSFTDFQKDWKGTVQITINDNGVKATQAQDKVQVSVDFVQLVNNGDSKSNVTTKFGHADLVIGLDKGNLRILTISTSFTTPTPTPVPTNTATPSPSPSGSPAISVSPASSSASCTDQGTATPYPTITITNTGGGTLNWSVSDNGGLTVAPANGHLAAGESTQIAISGQHDAGTVKIKFQSNGSNGGNATVTLLCN